MKHMGHENISNLMGKNPTRESRRLGIWDWPKGFTIKSPLG